MRDLILGFLLLVSLSSCERRNSKVIYPENPEWSTENGRVVDSSNPYLPIEVKAEATFLRFPYRPGAMYDQYRAVLLTAHAPVLFNYYLGHSIYRCVWLPGASERQLPAIFSLHKDDDHVWLTTRILDRSPCYMPRSLIKQALADSTNLSVSRTKDISFNGWIEFENLVNGIKFWDLQADSTQQYLDGPSTWYMEGHQEARYWIAVRNSSKSNIGICGQFLASLSGIDYPMP